MKWDEGHYNEYYSSFQCKKENIEIKRLLEIYFGDVTSVIDLGCGTGLGQDLIPPGIKYVGVDVNEKMIESCHKRRTGEFIACDAYDAIKLLEGPKLSLFSLSEFSYKAIVRFAKEARAFAVIFNKPYKKGSGSAFSEKKWRYRLQYRIKPLFIEYLLRTYGFKLFKLLDEPYYFVAVKGGKTWQIQEQKRQSLSKVA